MGEIDRRLELLISNGVDNLKRKLRSCKGMKSHSFFREGVKPTGGEQYHEAVCRQGGIIMQGMILAAGMRLDV